MAVKKEIICDHCLGNRPANTWTELSKESDFGRNRGPFYYQCRVCGSSWIKIRDYGLGGNDSFFHTQTGKFFKAS